LKGEINMNKSMEIKLVPIEHDGQRVITTELLAQAYETDTNNLKNNFNNHKDNFKEKVHYFLLKGDALRAFKREVNDIDLVAPNVNQLYLWTERGANRHCKILDTPKAWEQFDNLEETYFWVKEQRKKQLEDDAVSASKPVDNCAEKRATAMLLNAKNRTALFLQKLYNQAGVKPEYQAMALSSFYAVDGVDLPRIALQGAKVTYDKGTIAEKLGIYSVASGGKKPHAKAIGAIINQLNVAPEEREAVPYSRNGHDGTDYQYTDSVIEKIREWLTDKDLPKPICIDGKKYEVVYRNLSQS